MSDLDFDGIIADLDDGEVLDMDGPQPQIRSHVAPAPYRDPLQAEFDLFRDAAKNSRSRDEFYHFVEAQLQRAREERLASGFVGNPPSIMEQQSGGNAVILTPQASASPLNAKPLCRWQGKDSETTPVVITTSLITPLVTTVGVAIRPYLILKWGSFDTSHTAEIDIGNGRQIAVNASMIEVDAALDPTANSAAQVNIAAALSFRAPNRTSPLIRTKYIDSQAQGAGSAQTIAIPPFAIGLLPVQMSDITTPGVIQLDFIDSSNTTVYSLLVSVGAMTAPIPITSDIVAVKVTNTTATAQYIRLPFQLSI